MQADVCFNYKILTRAMHVYIIDKDITARQGRFKQSRDFSPMLIYIVSPSARLTTLQVLDYIDNARQ